MSNARVGPFVRHATWRVPRFADHRSDVRNNLFVVLPGADAAMMVLPPGPDDFVNNIFSPKAPLAVKTGTSGVIVISDPGLVDTYHLAPTSPAVDKGSPDAMQPWLDWDGHKVPCGSAPDIGAVEYCP